MTDELKSLIEDAAKLLGYSQCTNPEDGYYSKSRWGLFQFNPLDPERGDLMKVAEAARCSIRFGKAEVTLAELDGGYVCFPFVKGDHESLAIAILRAASAVYKSRGGV